VSITLPRALSFSTNPAGWLAAAGAVTAAVTMIVNALNHHGVISTGVVVAAVGAVGALLTRQAVTPTADPKNGAGVPLVPAVPVAPGTSSMTTTTTVTPSVVQITPNPAGGTTGKTE
jgi:hypothetical protein